MGRLRWRRTPHPAAAGSPAWRGAAAYGAFVAVLAGGFLQYIPGPPRGGMPAASAVHTVAAVHHIVLADLAVIEPSGVSAGHLARIGRVHGISQVLPLDGAQIVIGSDQVNVVGVDPQAYRAWTPLSTASNQRLWDSLGSGAFLASPSARRHLHLHDGLNYPVTGASTVSLRYIGTAPLGIAGIDLVVGSQDSARLGLVHDVVALISAPHLSIGKLRREVRAAVGPGPKLVTLRAQTPASAPISASSSPSTGGARPSTYIELFQASAAQFCPGLPWTVLAAIGQIESGDGTNNGPSSAGALGPMQFLPSTWAVWGISAFGEPGPPNIMDPYDAVPAAARYLCAAGGSTAAGLPGAIFAYNHANWYVAEVLALAQEYAAAGGG